MENAILSVTSVNSTLHHKVDITLDEEIPTGETVGVCQATDEAYFGDLTFELDPRNAYFAVDKGRLRLFKFSLVSYSYHLYYVSSARLSSLRVDTRLSSFSEPLQEANGRCLICIWCITFGKT